MLDSIVSERDKKRKSKNTAFLHKLYSVIEYEGNEYIAKITVEEFYNESINADSLRAYNLKAIKIEPASGREETNSTTPNAGEGSINTIADLYEHVKKYDKDFRPSKEVNPELLNDDGTPKELYHGTPEEFSVFDRSKIGSNFSQSGSGNYGGFFFTDKMTHAKSYGKNIMAAYLSMENPYVVEASDFSYNAAEYWDMHSEAMQEAIMRDGYDGVIIIHPRGSLYVVKESNQIKSATDNIGTFDITQPDIRYSRKGDVTDVNSVLSENEELREAAEELQKALEIAVRNNDKLKQEFKITGKRNLSENATTKVATYLRQQYGSSMDKGKLTEKLMQLYDYMVNAGDSISMDYVANTATDIARELMSETNYWDDSRRQEFKDTINMIRNTRLYASEDVKGIDDYNDFRKRSFGKIRLVNDANAMGVEELYDMLAQQGTSVVSGEAVGVEDQLNEILDFMESTKPVVRNAAEERIAGEGLTVDEYANIIRQRGNIKNAFCLSTKDVLRGAEGGIRTHAPFRTNGFQDRLVMTTSIPLH